MDASFATGASGVLGAYRFYWWPLRESSFCSVKEIYTERIQWNGNFSHQACTAGLYGLVSIWSGNTDYNQAKRMSEMAAKMRLCVLVKEMRMCVCVRERRVDERTECSGYHDDLRKS